MQAYHRKKGHTPTVATLTRMNSSSAHHSVNLSNSDGGSIDIMSKEGAKTIIAMASSEDTIPKRTPSLSTTSMSEHTPKKKRSKSNKSRPEGKPTRPLSAYNIFFRSERERMIASMDQGGKRLGSKRTGISFEHLAKSIASKWHSLDSAGRADYENDAVADRERYRAEMAAWRATDAGRRHQLRMKEERMARAAGSKLSNNLASGGTPKIGHPCSDDASEEDDDLDDSLTPLQRMFRRGDAMFEKQAKKKQKTQSLLKESNRETATAASSPILHSVASSTKNQVEFNSIMTSSSMSKSDQTTTMRNHTVSLPLTLDLSASTNREQIQRTNASWARETKLLLSRGQGLLQDALNLQGDHGALEAHKKALEAHFKVAALSNNAGLLPAQKRSAPASVGVVVEKTSSSDQPLLDGILCPEDKTSIMAGKKLCDSFILPSSARTSAQPTNLAVAASSNASSATKNSNTSMPMPSSPSHSSMGTINSVTNLLGSNQSIQDLLCTKRIIAAGENMLRRSEDSSKTLVSVDELAATFSSTSLCDLLRGSAPPVPRGGKASFSSSGHLRAAAVRQKQQQQQQQAKGERGGSPEIISSFPSVVKFSSATSSSSNESFSPKQSGFSSRRRLSLKSSAVGRVSSSLSSSNNASESRKNATWTPLPVPDLSGSSRRTSASSHQQSCALEPTVFPALGRGRGDALLGGCDNELAMLSSMFPPNSEMK